LPPLPRGTRRVRGPRAAAGSPLSPHDLRRERGLLPRGTRRVRGPFAAAGSPSPRITCGERGGVRGPYDVNTQCSISELLKYYTTVKSNPRTVRARTRSRTLRRHGSDAEALLWRHLRGRQLADAKFRRQHPIGPYFADFCCVEARLVIELDGGQHAVQVAGDARRTRYLAAEGFRVLRFWNDDVLLRTNDVLETIEGQLRNPSPLPSPRKRMRGEGVCVRVPKA
jgi:very-short-patch-repair endonuclease